MTNAEVIQTITVKELVNFIEWVQLELLLTTSTMREIWLRSDSNAEGGLLSDEMKKYWKVH